MTARNMKTEVVHKESRSYMQEIVDAADNWTNDNKMSLNAKKRIKDMWISFTSAIPEPPPLHIRGTKIERVNVFKILGVWF